MSQANGGGTAYSECTEVTSIVAAKTGQWGYLGLRDGKISQNGDGRNYRLQLDNNPTSHTAHALCIADGVVEYCLNSWCETSPPPPPPSASPSPPPPTQALSTALPAAAFPTERCKIR